MSLENSEIKSKILSITSKDRSSSSKNTNDFSVNLGSDPSLTSVIAVAVKEIAFYNTEYNINEITRYFTYKRLGFTYTINIPAYNYTIEQFLIALTTAFGLNGIFVDSISVQADGRLLFQFSNPIGIEFFDIHYLDGTINPMAQVCGIVSSPETNGNHYSYYYAPALPNLAGLNVVQLHSKALCVNGSIDSNKKAVGRAGDILDIIAVNVRYGGLVQKIFASGATDAIYGQYSPNLSNIDIRLTDDAGNDINLHGTHVNVVFKLYYT